MKELNVEDQIYLCKYHDVDNSLNLSLGINHEEAEQILSKLKRNGLYEQYRNLDEYEYDKIIKREKNMNKFERILHKYNFHLLKDTEFEKYKSMEELLTISSRAKSEKDLKLIDIINAVAAKKGKTKSIISNDCNRILDKVYQNNKELFNQNGYKNKPSIKEFILKELKILEKQKNTKPGNTIREKIQFKKNKLQQISQNDNYKKHCLEVEIDVLEELLK